MGGPDDEAGGGERMVKFWIAEMGRIWCTVFGGEVAIASRFVRGQTVNRLPSRIGKKGAFVIKRILVKSAYVSRYSSSYLDDPRTFLNLYEGAVARRGKHGEGNKLTVHRSPHSAQSQETQARRWA